jgi:hypothetical protein
MKNLNKRGGKGMLTLGCLPLWGREGVTLLAAAENKRITRYKWIVVRCNFPMRFPSLMGHCWAGRLMQIAF